MVETVDMIDNKISEIGNRLKTCFGVMESMKNDLLKYNVIELKKQLKCSNENKLKCVTLFMDSRLEQLRKLLALSR